MPYDFNIDVIDQEFGHWGRGFPFQSLRLFDR